MVDNLADTLTEVEAVTLGDTWGHALALVNNLADTLAEVEAVTLRDARGDAHAVVELFLRRWHWWRPPQPLLPCQPKCQPVRAYHPVCRLLPPPLVACQPV